MVLLLSSFLVNLAAYYPPPSSLHTVLQISNYLVMPSLVFYLSRAPVSFSYEMLFNVQRFYGFLVWCPTKVLVTLTDFGIEAPVPWLLRTSFQMSLGQDLVAGMAFLRRWLFIWFLVFQSGVLEIYFVYVFSSYATTYESSCNFCVIYTWFSVKSVVFLLTSWCEFGQFVHTSMYIIGMQYD